MSLPPRPGLLAGREELLAAVDARLTGGPGPEPRVVTLYGLGGAGKTSVAVEYAHRHLAEVGLAWQFPAEDHTLLLAEFARLAAQLGAREMVDARDPVASVHAVLAAFPAGWLLVFDNARGQGAVRRFLPPAGKGRVLITSQSAAWPHGQAMEVPVLDTVVAARFLMNRTGDPDERAALDLARELGGLPLALEQSAAYIQATGSSLGGYLALFRDRRADLLARGQAAGHPADVAATLGLALSQLEDETPAAAGLLRLLAYLAPEPVPLALLLAGTQAAALIAPAVAAVVGPLLGDLVAAGDAIAALRRYSLVTPAGNGLVLVHRLVQEVTLARVSAGVAAEWKQAAAAVVEAAVPADTTLPAAWPACAVLLPHARAVLDLTSDGIRRIAQYLGFSGSHQAARELYTRIVDAYRDSKDYGPEHPDALNARASLARWSGEAGDAAGARDQFAALLAIEERVQGHEHPDTLDIRANLARWTGDAGDDARARDQFAALLPIEERVQGPEHPDTLDTRARLAYYTGVAGDAAGARDQFAALLPIRERVQGPEHPDTLNTRGNLAGWAGAAGDVAGARDQYTSLLPIRERVQGPEHPSTLNTRASLARWTGEAGDAASARDQFGALLPILQRVQGPEHPITLSVRASLARWTQEAKTPDADAGLFDRAPKTSMAGSPVLARHSSERSAPVSSQQTGTPLRAGADELVLRTRHDRLTERQDHAERRLFAQPRPFNVTFSDRDGSARAVPHGRQRADFDDCQHADASWAIGRRKQRYRELRRCWVPLHRAVHQRGRRSILSNGRLVRVSWKAPDPASSQSGARIVASTDLPSRFSAVLSAS